MEGHKLVQLIYENSFLQQGLDFANGPCAVEGCLTPIKATSEEPTCIQDYLPISVW
jgi:hypothetical protein